MTFSDVPPVTTVAPRDLSDPETGVAALKNELLSLQRDVKELTEQISVYSFVFLKSCLSSFN